jgi:hypothetical protein
MKTMVYALVEHLPIGGSGISQQEVHGEHPTIEDAVAAKRALCAARPELVGSLTVEVRESTAKQTERVEEVGGGGTAAVSAVGGGDGAQGAGGGGGPLPDVPALRPAGRGVPRRAVEPALPGVSEAGDESVD